MKIQFVIQRSPIIAACALVAAGALIFISESTNQQSVSSMRSLDISLAGRASLRDLHLNMQAAESAKRGFLLTDRAVDLKLYAAGVARAEKALVEVHRHYEDDQKTRAVLLDLDKAVQAKVDEMAQTLALNRQGQRPAALALMQDEAGQAPLQAIGHLSSRLLALETQLIQERRADLMTVLNLSRAGIAGLCVIGLLALYLYLRQAADLAHFQGEIKRLVTHERDRLEIEVRDRTEQLTELTNHLQTAREDERNRLARNLHDDLGALLTSAKLDAARIKSRLAQSTQPAPEAQERLAHLVETLNRSIALGRNIIEDLRPSTLANLGLVPTLEIMLRDFAQNSNVKVHESLQPVALSARAELAVYRLVQEAITNLTKYAHAAQLRVSLSAQGGEVTVSIRDDGVGFDPAVKTRSAYGLLGMRFRVEAVQGRMTVQSTPGYGTHLRVVLPESA